MKANTVLKNSCWAILSAIVITMIFYYYLDLPIANFFYFHSDPWLVNIASDFFKPVFSPHHWLIISMLTFLFGLLSYFTQRKSLAKKLFFFTSANIVCYAITGILKISLARYRPELFFEEGQYGFHFFSTQNLFTSMPSGHSASLFAGFYAFYYLIQKRWVALILGLIALLVVISRLVCLEHYASDVITGAYVGILSVYWSRTFISDI